MWHRPCEQPRAGEADAMLTSTSRHGCSGRSCWAAGSTAQTRSTATDTAIVSSLTGLCTKLRSLSMVCS